MWDMSLFVHIKKRSALISCIGNRRLDEWVNVDRFNFTTTPKESCKANSGVTHRTDQPDRKITRNQKRKHDEINHSSKVGHISYLLYSILSILLNYAVILCVYFKKYIN